MATDLESSTSLVDEVMREGREKDKRPERGWLRVGILAATSALVGGLAAAWFYRKTLARLRQAETNGQGVELRPSETGFEERL